MPLVTSKFVVKYLLAINIAYVIVSDYFSKRSFCFPERQGRQK